MRVLTVLLPFLCAGSGVVAATLAPAAIQPSSITLRVGPELRFADAASGNNLASPVSIGADLYVIDQRRSIGIWDGNSVRTVLDAASVPDGVTPVTREAFLNIAGKGQTAYVAYTSSTLPSGASAAALPDDPSYQTASDHYQIIYRYDRAEDGSLSSPALLAAFQRSVVGHSGGGMLALSEDQVLFAAADYLSQDHNGQKAPQSASDHPGSLLLIDGTTGEVQTAAIGIRNVQQLTRVGDDVAFSDIGWTVAEEINRVPVAALQDTSVVENFGWGVAGDGMAREGTFYVSDGPESAATVLGVAPSGEDGFMQPHAQFGRPDPGLFAITGPVASAALGGEIDLLFGELVGGAFYATLSGAGDLPADVFELKLVDEYGDALAIGDLAAGFSRADLRFFTFPDGQAGFVLEKHGTAYALSIFAVPVPVTASLPLLAGACCVMQLARRSRPGREEAGHTA